MPHVTLHSSDSLQDVPDITKIFNIVQAVLEAQKPKPPKIKIILHTKTGFYELLETSSKRRKNEEEDIESNTVRTRSKQPELFELSTSTHYRRPKVYPSYTPWGDYWNFRDLNDLYPKKSFKWDSSDVPGFDLGDPLDEINFWEQPWIAANEEKKKFRGERERKRKRQQRYGGLKAEGRKRAYKKGTGATPLREKGKFVKQGN